MPTFSLGAVLLAAASAHALIDGSADFYSQLGAAAVSNATAYLTLLTEAAVQTGARCLDGSPGAYYYRKGSGSGASKWYIHHQGGGWCESWDDCLGRSRGDLGSSAKFPAAQDLATGYFSPQPDVNPMMYNWNLVYLRYCDGGSFSGNNETVATYGGKQLYFRGKRIREAAYASLVATKGLKYATDVVISGCSAGGLATFLHTDQWCDALAADAPGVKCVGMPDSGFFLDYQSPTVPGELKNTRSGNYHAGLRWCFETFNSTAGVNQDCVSAHSIGGGPAGSAAYLCQFAEHTAVYTHTPMFALQSEYDSWQTHYVLAPGEDAQILGNNISRLLRANLLSPHPESGAFLDSCHHHCAMWNHISIDGELVSVAFAKWYDSIGTAQAAKRLWRQGKPYPCPGCCSPYGLRLR